MINTYSKRWNIFLNVSFFLLLAISILIRILILLTVNIDSIDSDQPFFWGGIKDYSQGLFYEPRMYGQNYNTFLECLVGAPLLWFDVPVYYALPIATHILFLFPFVFTASYLFIKKKKEAGLLVLCVLLCMTPGYDIMNGIPRGFVTGIFFTSFFILSFLNPNNLRFIALNTFLSVLGYFVNPNCLVVSSALLLYLFLHNYKRRNYYIVTGVCLLMYLPLHLFFNQFYIDHPSRIIYGINYEFGFKPFLENICHLDQEFQHIGFFIENNCLSVLVAICLLMIALFRKNKKAFYAGLGFLAVVLLSFFSNKTRDGYNWPFYSFSRMYLGIPVIICLLGALVINRATYLTGLLVFVTLFYSAFKLVNFNKNMAHHREQKYWLYVHLLPLNEILESMRVYKKFCDDNHTNHMLISVTFYPSTFLANGGPAVYDDFPETELTRAEHRYWVREGNKDKIFSKFILISVNYNLDKVLGNHPEFKMHRLDDYGVFLISENKMPNGAFISLVDKAEG